jgi:hypothetical protein
MTVADRRVRSIRVSLAVVAAFCALSAVGGAGAMLLTDGLGMPLSILDSSPFTSFVIPALVLLFVVGGTQSLALVQLLRHRAPALLCSAVAGFGLVIWIYVETVIIRGFSALQGIYLVPGLLELALVLALLGIVSWIPRAP